MPAGVEPAAEPAYPGKGFRLAEFTITGLLGQGAMATVYQAEDRSGMEVALKVFHENAGVSTLMLERFKREALASKKLRRHPNIITVYSTGNDGPYHYIAMQAIKNSMTLDRLLESSTLRLEQVIRLVIKVARALQYAHSRNIIHRDVKPGNIMIDEFGEPRLSDFGVAAMVDWPSFTLAGALTGTPLYMSPEQANADNTAAASDVYSLGVVLYEAICGVLPYTVPRTSPIREVLRAVKEELPRRPRLFRKDISPELEAVILKALEKDPHHRYVDAEAFAVDLERILAGRPVSAHHFTFFDRISHFIRVHERITTTIGLLLVVGLGTWLYARNLLIQTRLENLAHLAWMHNARSVLNQTLAGEDQNLTLPRAWQEIRIARRAMLAGNFESAIPGLASGVEISKQSADYRTAAIAQHDLARCLAVAGRMDEAVAAYREILSNADAPPALAGLAQADWAGIAMLQGRKEEIDELLSLRKPPSEGPLRTLLEGLLGRITVREFVHRMDDFPVRFLNDAQFALAVRLLRAGEKERAAEYFRQTAAMSMPSTEWPGPLARNYARHVK